MAKFPYLSGRRGSKSLYYKRMVPLELRAEGHNIELALPAEEFLRPEEEATM